MTKIRFTFQGYPGFIELHPGFGGGSFVQVGGMGVHYIALRGDLKQAVDAAIAAAA
jgi:hypothetical protein